jgi:hypothetical protein
LDERVSGIVMEEAPLELELEGGKVLRTAEVCELLPPRRLAVLGLLSVDRDFEKMKEVYGQLGKSEFLRLERETHLDVNQDVLNWLIQRSIK